MQQQFLTMFRGNTKKWTAALKLGGLPLNLTGATGLWFTARRAPGANPPVFQKSIGAGIAVTDAAGGIASITLQPADTAGLPSQQVQLSYDLEYEAGGEVYTVAAGRILVEPDITVR